MSNTNVEETFEDSVEQTPTNQNKTIITARNQGKLKALAKLTRGLEKATYQQGLVDEAKKIEKPIRGLIPKLAPKVPEPDIELIIQWEDILQETATKLTTALGDYWNRRASYIQEEKRKLGVKIESSTDKDQWEKMKEVLEEIATTTSQDLRRKKPPKPKKDKPERKIATAASRNATTQPPQ